MVAHVEAGVLGPRLEEQLGARGYTYVAAAVLDWTRRRHGAAVRRLRHYPQSFEFSTVGGWVATRAGGTPCRVRGSWGVCGTY